MSEKQPGTSWKGVSRTDFNRYIHHINPNGRLSDFEAWRKDNPTAELPAIVKGAAGIGLAGIQAPSPAAGADGQLADHGPAARTKVPEKFKSQEFRAFQREELTRAGHPTFAVYKRLGGKLWYRGTTDSPRHEAIANDFGGGSFEVRTLDQAGYEITDAGYVFERNIDPAVFPEKHVQNLSLGAPWSFPAGAGAGMAGQSFTQEDIQEAERRARGDAVREAELNALRARISSGGLDGIQPARTSDLDLFDKFLGLQQKLQGPVAIVPPPKTQAEAMTEMVSGMTTMMTAIKSMQDLVPKAESSGPSLVEKTLARVVEAYVDPKGAPISPAPAQPQPAAAPAAPQGAAPAAAAPAPQPTAMDNMLSTLSAKITQMQQLEFSGAQEDTVIPMARWVLAQQGLPWNMLRSQVKDHAIDHVVEFIGAQNPGLTDSDTKKAWLWQVVELVKDPGKLEQARPATPSAGA